MSLRILSPGRINLIGEHIDYNGGFVLPAAINKDCVFAVEMVASTTCKLYAKDLDETHEFDISSLQKSKEKS